MRYIPNTAEDCRRMLERIGVETIEDLFSDIPEAVRLRRPLNLPPPLAEEELLRHLQSVSERNTRADSGASFVGAGAYRHFIPVLVDQLLLRGEFLTAYTPYQAEVSQGVLQAVYEFQTLICQLTGMEAANASLYDGASAAAEGALMARRITNRDRILVGRSVHPEWRQVLATYLGKGSVAEIPFTSTGESDLHWMKDHTGPETAGVILQTPNFFGILEDLGAAAEIAHRSGSLLIAAVSEGISLGLLQPPGLLGADIVAGEGQSFGLPISFGGPYLGFFATRQEHVRQMPGRLVGETLDTKGRKAYVLTLATREQHIRRERATSNICTNQGLCALAATIYLTALGKEGLREQALLNLAKAHYAKSALSRLPGWALAFSGPTFNEFVLKAPTDPDGALRRLLAQNIVGGLALQRFYPELDRHLLLCVTEENPRTEIDRLVSVLERI